MAPYVCIEWPKTPQNLSITMQVYLDASLNTITAVNMKTDVRNSMPEWNVMPARNPLLQETTSTASDEVFVRATITELPANVYAQTTNSFQGSSPYHIIHSDIAFNRLIGWNHSYDFSVTPGSNYYHADSRKVATHELGHSEGLGHTGINPAIMRQGATTYWWAQWNDQQGIVAIYGAYP